MRHYLFHIFITLFYGGGGGKESTRAVDYKHDDSDNNDGRGEIDTDRPTDGRTSSGWLVGKLVRHRKWVGSVCCGSAVDEMILVVMTV